MPVRFSLFLIAIKVVITADPTAGSLETTQSRINPSTGKMERLQLGCPTSSIEDTLLGGAI
jgi:hypothetical protein